MGRPGLITKQWLLDHNIVYVSEDGSVIKKRYKDGTEGICTIYTSKKSTKYQDKIYNVVGGIYTNEEYNRQKVSYANRGTFASGNKTLVVNRIVWAWYFDGENGNVSDGARLYLGGDCPPYTCPAGLDIDHINNISTDNHFSNLQLLTRKENNAKRKGHMNQHENSLRE